MKSFFQIVITLALVPLVTSCARSYDEVEESNTSATINGFYVQWSKYTTSTQQQAITDILNDMVSVEGGYFMMGNDATYDADARDNESPIHPVFLTDYYIMAHEVSYEQVLSLLDKQQEMYDLASSKKINFDFNDWMYFIKVLNEKSGLEFSLPTEAQWEFAARGGNKSKGYKYPGSDKWEDVWSESRDCAPITVANELGIYNMADGYAEWCLDTYGEYSKSYIPVTNPLQNNNPQEHVVRGGCYESQALDESRNWKTGDFYYASDKRMCRSTARGYYKTNIGRYMVKCRIVYNKK